MSKRRITYLDLLAAVGGLVAVLPPRRERIAAGLLAGMMANPERRGDVAYMAQGAVNAADELIRCLEATRG